ncbi:hypothetical protein [Luteimonas kalidii]|uniref:Tetratricopeptide repeat protein n=1 Tax=Luteimonas kalidii TaxID=3042025 RepID=A0ABT6JQZ3_9GAMM|nr:hypothetical protein [Luteimonas kalidii]MDH5833092.1 hypothetical protein [Luteimonas kalidii]
MRPRGRREPVVGDLRGLRLDARAGPPGERPPVRPATRPQRWIIALAVAAALAATAALLRDPLAERMWPEARVHALTDDAAAALAHGHLSAPDGSGARELYEAARAIDPDQLAPRAGLARVADAALAQASASVDAGRFADAHAHLRLARELSIPRERADAVAGRLRGREATLAGLDGLVLQAESARAAGRLHGDDSAALPLYARVLALDPGRADALRGRDDALAALLQQARTDLRQGDLQAAATGIAAARGYDPGHVDLPDTEARLTEELDALRRRAAVDLAGGRIDAAVATWRRLQQFDPDDAGARDGLQQAAAALARQAQRQGADFRFAEADAILARARALAPDAAAVASAQSALERARQRHAQLQASSARPDRADRVPGLLRQAAEAEARGDLLTPPGDSAYDRLRAAQAIAPRDANVQRAVARLLPSARACFERQLSANDLARARRCLDAREALGESASAMTGDRRRLAQRWLAIGDERLGAGQLDAASAALASARAIDPRAPGIEEFQRRLRVASRG